jgi:hypothetical protein
MANLRIPKRTSLAISDDPHQIRSVRRHDHRARFNGHRGCKSLSTFGSRFTGLHRRHAHQVSRSIGQFAAPKQRFAVLQVIDDAPRPR